MRLCFFGVLYSFGDKQPAMKHMALSKKKGYNPHVSLEEIKIFFVAMYILVTIKGKITELDLTRFDLIEKCRICTFLFICFKLSSQYFNMHVKLFCDFFLMVHLYKIHWHLGMELEIATNWISLSHPSLSIRNNNLLQTRLNCEHNIVRTT